MRAIRPILAAPLLLAALACGEEAGARAAAAPPPRGLTLVDDVGRTVRLPGHARRIVSIKPSATETLVAFGAGDLLVGRSDFDAEPAVAALPSVGGTVPNLEVLTALAPDLMLVWESTTPTVRDRIEALGIPTFALSTRDTAEVFRSFRTLGTLTGRGASADSLARAVRAELDRVAASVRGLPRPTTLVVVWNDPPMTAGPDTYLGELVSIAGGEAAFPELGGRFANVALEEIVRRQPEVVILPRGEDDRMDPAALAEAPGWRELRALRTPRRIPGDLISRAGPTLGETARRLRDAIHPETAP